MTSSCRDAEHGLSAVGTAGSTPAASRGTSPCAFGLLQEPPRERHDQHKQQKTEPEGRPCQDVADVPAEGLRSLPARTALYARTRTKMARQARHGGASRRAGPAKGSARPAPPRSCFSRPGRRRRHSVPCQKPARRANRLKPNLAERPVQEKPRHTAGAFSFARLKTVANLQLSNIRGANRAGGRRGALLVKHQQMSYRRRAA